VLVVFAITAASMLAVVGLLYSFGLVLTQRRALQSAADAASLSGSWQVLRELASDNRSDAAVLASVVQFATSNGSTSNSAVYLDASGAQLTNVGSGGAFPLSARGVRVTVQNQVSTILPGFLKVAQVLANDSASAIARPTASPPTASLVIPIAISVSDAQSAYAGHTLYDLFAHPVGGQAPTLNLASSGAPTFGTLATNIQYWSDGQHSGAWQLSQPGNATLAGSTYYDSIASGLQDNVRRQGLSDSSLATYGVVTLPVYDTSTSTTVHIAGFVQVKLLNSNITPTSARGTLVPYPAAAWGTPVVPTPDLGAALVGLVS
jgi:hypothetical protein